MRWGELVLLALLASSVCVATPVSAQSAEDGAAAREAFDEGTAHYEAGHWMLAAQAFHRAWELLEGSPRRPLILFNEARALEEVPGRECDARAKYEQFLLDADESLPGVQERLQAGRVRLRELNARMEGRGDCDAEEEQEQETGSEEAPPAGGISPIGPVVMAAGGAALIAGAITGALALAARSDLRNTCGQDMVCPESSRGRVHHLQALAVSTDVLLPLGALAAGAGLLLTLLLHEPPADTPVSAWCSPTGCGALLRGRM